MFLDTPEVSITAVGYDNDLWGPTAVLLHPSTMEKVASDIYVPERLVEFMGNLRPRSDGRYILLNALGAGEYWGVNKNGDWFPEWSLKGDPAPPKVMEYVRAKNLPVPSIYGYRTFELMAWPYRHHNNGGPEHSIGDRVCCSAYNDRMHRVELVVFISQEKAPDLVKKIDAGEAIPWSMGAKLLWDTCSICGNAARNRNEYCDHLKKHLNTVYPDGRKVFAYNYFPRFFDISAVYVPADRSAYSLRKVAMDRTFIDMGFVAQPDLSVPQVAEGMEKFAGLIEFLESGGTKEADIEKEIPSQEPGKDLGSAPISPDLWRFMFDMAKKDQEECEPISAEKIKELKDSPIDKVLSALTSLGIILKPKEVDSLTEGNDEMVPEGLDFSEPDPTLLSKLKDLVGPRSTFDPHFSVRIIRIVKKEPGEPERGITLIKKGAAYQKYKRLLRDSVDLEKMAQVVSHPRVQMALNPDSIEKQIIGVRDPANLPFPSMVAPFVASIGLDD